MRNLKFKIFNGTLAIMLSLFTFISCNDDDNSTSTLAPTITGVSTALEDEPVTQGYADNMYIIRGTALSTTQKIYFNDFDTYFNTTLVTDDVIIVKINRITPYADVTNEIKIVTNYGEAVYTFVVAPPAPNVTGFNPVNAVDGETVIVKGNFFLDPVVTIGGAPATVVSNSLSEIEVVIPSNSKNKFITVTTISGESTSTVAVGTAIFDDIFYYGLGLDLVNYPGGTIVTDADALSGNKYLKYEVGAWTGIDTFPNWDGTPVSEDEYYGIGLWVKADNPTTGFAFMFNGWNDSNLITLTTEWQFIEIPWSNYNEWDRGIIQRLSFVNRSGDPITYYVDDICLIPAK